ncbi:MAG TPA: CHAP domain-containing protein [Rhizomicrobium sp.]|jgi:hypothetical protein|nr:CHAP domain-containing protein [Rhizomicrobium sp.]
MTSKTLCCLTLAAAMLLPSGAFARNHKNALTSFAVPAVQADLVTITPRIVVPVVFQELTVTRAVPATTEAAAAPSVLEPLKRLSCVPYARLRSGLQIFGDAKLWWGKAKDLYSQFATPVKEAVMVFSGTGRLKRGHVAVVTQVVNAREIKVDHANWQNHGEIDLNMPVLDVSANNDWSEVRVWNVSTNSFGTHVYKISGFISTNQTVDR